MKARQYPWLAGAMWAALVAITLPACADDECVCDANTEICVISGTGNEAAEESYVCAELPTRCENNKTCSCVSDNYPDCTCSKDEDGLIRIECPS